MEDVTLGQIKDVVLFIVAFAGGITALYALLMKGIKKLLEPINNELHNEKMKRLKSDLTTLMCLAESNVISKEQIMLAHEEYDEYISNKGNSFVKEKFESLHKEGKI